MRHARRPGWVIGWTLLIGLAGLIVAIGATLDWSTLTLRSAGVTRTGLDSGGGGDLAAILGLLLAAATVTRLSARSRRVLGPLAVGVGILVLVVVSVELLSVATPVATGAAAPRTTVGIGVWTTAIGGVAALVAGAGLFLTDRRRGG